MLIRSNQLTLNEASSILDESIYLTESEAALNPVAVPVLENERLGICTVSYNDIQRVCEDYGCYMSDALCSIAENAGIDVDSIAVAIDESDIILDPKITNEFPKYVVKPISEYSDDYMFTECCMDAFVESGDYVYIDVLLNELADPSKKVKKMNYSDALQYMISVVNSNHQQTGKNIVKSRKIGEKGAKDQEIINRMYLYKKFPKLRDAVEKATNQTAKMRDNTWTSADATASGFKTAQAAKKETEDRLGNFKGIGTTSFDANNDFSGIGRKWQEKVNNSQKDDIVYGRQSGTVVGTMRPTDQSKKPTNVPGPAGNAIKDGEEALQGNVEPGRISKVVASLRKYYSNFLQKANQEHDEGKLKWYKNIARVILNLIDKLLAKLDKSK